MSPLIRGQRLREQTAGVRFFFQAHTLAVPKIFCGIRLEYFDRGAKPCSLHRPQDALRKLCSLHKGGLPSGLLIFPSSVFFGKAEKSTFPQGKADIEPPLPKGGRATKWRGDSLKTVRPVFIGRGYNPSVIAARCHLPLHKGGLPSGLISNPSFVTFGDSFSERKALKEFYYNIIAYRKFICYNKLL